MTSSIEAITAEQVAAFAALIDAAGDAGAMAENPSEPDPGSYSA